jgi:hypothetical protein
MGPLSQSGGPEDWQKKKNLSYIICDIKLKVKLSLSFNWASHLDGVLEDCRHKSTYCLTSALDGGEWLASRPGRFNSTEGSPSTHCIGGWVGPRAGLDSVLFPVLAGIRTPDHPVLYHWAIPAPHFVVNSFYKSLCLRVLIDISCLTVCKQLPQAFRFLRDEDCRH